MAGGGGGLIFDALSKLKLNRSQRTSSRAKFNGNFSEDSILKPGPVEKIEFPKLPEDQVIKGLERIRSEHQKRKRNRIWILSIAIVITSIVIGVLYVKTKGFEYWDSILPM